MKIKLHPINRSGKDNRYCGPAVVSFLTGLNTAEISRLMRARSGRTMITGSDFSEFEFILNSHGIYVAYRHFIDKNTRPTLAAWAKNRDRSGDTTYLIVAGNHWQIVQGIRYACGRIGEICSIRDKRIKRRARVQEIYILEKR